MTRDELLAAYKRGKRDFGGADLGGAYLRGADLGGAYLRGADLGGAYLGGAYLRGADLGGADLGGAYLRGAYLRGAYLGGAYLRGAYLRGADLRGAYLRGAYLRGADLRGADLRGADLGEGKWIIQGPVSKQGHAWLLVNLDDSGVRVRAGCHTFTFTEAREYWADSPKKEEMYMLLRHLVELAKSRGYALPVDAET